MSKVCEESNKIIDDMLAKKYVDGEVHVSISIGNDEIDNVDTVGMARGIKARHCSRKGRKRVLSWVEKLAKKTKRCSQKKEKDYNPRDGIKPS
jgi:formylmethanofuran dehydrogenase subunit E-like metal-binding protein